MKRVTLLFCAFLMCMSLSVSAQKPFAGIIKSKTYVEGTTDANLISQYQMEFDKVILGNKSKQVTNQGGIGSTIIMDGGTSIMTFIFDFTAVGFGQYYFMDTADYKLTKYEYSYDKNDTKTIAGYNCYKASCVVTNLENDETQDIVFYVTQDLTKDYKSFEYPELKGFPLYISVQMENDGNPYILIQETTEVLPSKKVKEIDFLLPDKSLHIKDAPEELKKMFGMDADEDE